MTSRYFVTRLIVLSTRIKNHWGETRRSYEILNFTRSAASASTAHDVQDFKRKRLPMLVHQAEVDVEGKEQAVDDIVFLLKQILGLDTTRKAEQILLKHDQFQSVRYEQIKSTSEFLENNGIPKMHLQKNPMLLLMEPGAMIEKAATLESVLKIHEFRTASSLFHLPTQRILRIGSIWKKEMNVDSRRRDSAETTSVPPFLNRIQLLACRLDCESHDVSEMMRRTPSLTTSPLASIEAKIACMLENGILPEDIVSDPFVFTNVLHKIETKLALCKENGLTNVKPWMLRCTPLAFLSYLQRVREEAELRSGHSDITSFLATALKCSTNKASEILLRVPSIRTSSATKLNEMIQFLLSKGFTSDQILENPRILAHKVETIEDRLSQLQGQGQKPKSLAVLCYTSHDLAALLKRLNLTSGLNVKD